MAALPEARREAPEDYEQQHQQSQSGVKHQQQQPQHQHSLFVARAAWSTLRRALLTLQEAVSVSIDVTAHPAVAYLQVRGGEGGGGWLVWVTGCLGWRSASPSTSRCPQATAVYRWRTWLCARSSS